MSACLEFEGKNVEKAVDKACKELCIIKEELKYDVVSYGSTGIFGLVGTKKAKIIVTAPPEHVQKHEETNDSHNEQHTVSDQLQTEPTVDNIDNKRVCAFSDEHKELCKTVIQKMIDLITTDAKISIEELPDKIVFNIKGGNSAVLIGKHGQTLEAIQYLVEKIVNKRSEQRVRVQIDVEGYLENRRANLKSTALRLAEKSKRTGKPVTIGQMNTTDRRIVHLVLKNDDKVRTQSMGEGLYRKLVIFPKNNYRKKKNNYKSKP